MDKISELKNEKEYLECRYIDCLQKNGQIKEKVIQDLSYIMHELNCARVSKDLNGILRLKEQLQTLISMLNRISNQIKELEG